MKKLYIFLFVSLVANLALLFFILSEKTDYVEIPVDENTSVELSDPKDVAEVTTPWKGDDEEPTTPSTSKEEAVYDIRDVDILNFVYLLDKNAEHFKGTENEDFYNINRGYAFGDEVGEKYNELFECLDGKKTPAQMSTTANLKVCKWDDKYVAKDDANYGFINYSIKTLKKVKNDPKFDCSTILSKSFDWDKDNIWNVQLYMGCKGMLDNSSDTLIDLYRDMKDRFSDGSCDKLSDKNLRPYCDKYFSRDEN